MIAKIRSTLRPSLRSFRHGSAALVLLAMAIAPCAHGLAAGGETDARAFFVKFVAAQNAHDISGVKAMLWNSPDTLMYGRGVETRGRDAVADHFREYYEGTWHLEPDMSQFRATAISNVVTQILVPIVFTRGLPGEPSRDNTFLISQTLVHDADGWHVAAILPIANTRIK